MSQKLMASEVAVHSACTDLAECGIRPTLDAVQRITGGGQTKISAHVKTWWAKNAQYDFLKKKKRSRVKRSCTNGATIREAVDWIVDVIRIAAEVHWKLPLLPMIVKSAVDERLKELSLNAMRKVRHLERSESERDEFIVGSDRSRRETNFNDEDIERLGGE